MATQLYAPSAVGTMTMINVKDYGAIGDNTADDTNAINFAIAAANAAIAGGAARGADLYFPAGVYKVTSTLSIITSNVMVSGAGWQSTVVIAGAAFTTGNIFTLGSGAGHSGAGMKSISVWSTNARTTGASIDINAMNDCLIKDVVINNCFQGIYIHGASIKVWVHHAEINNTNSTANAAGILVTNGLAGDTYLWQIVMSNGSASTAGIQITQSGHFEIIGCNITKATNGLLINPGAAATYVSYGFIEHSLLDSCVTNALYINANSNADAQVRSLYFNDCWFSGSTGTGYGVQLNITTSGVVNDINFNFCRFLNNQREGVLFSSAVPTNINFIRCTIAGNGAAASNTYDGVTIPANTSGVTISYSKIGGNVGTAGNTQRYAISVAAGTSSDLKFVNNDCQPNGTVGTNGYINIGALTGGGNIIRDNQPCVYAGDGQASVGASGAITTTETIIHPVKRYLGNAIYPGTTWKWYGRGACTITTAAAVPGKFIVRMGTNGSTPASDTAVATFTLGTSAGISGPIDFDFEIHLSCRSVGASAAFMATLYLRNNGTTGIFTAAVQGPLAGTMATVSSVNANYVYLTFGNTGSVNVSCTFQQVHMTVETPGNNN